MENRQDAAWREAIACLPETRAAMLREIAMQDKIEELRLRCGEAPGVRTGGREQTLALPPVTADELRETVSRASRYSLHSCAESMKNGFLPLAGGHRLGLCGTAVTENGAVTGVRRISSLNLRVARQIETIDRILLPFAAENPLLSLLVLAPPGCGKTTLVREWVRLVSDAGHTVAVADERGEIAGLFEGVPQFRVGRHTDILEGCTKKQAALMLLKTMSPALLAFRSRRFRASPTACPTLTSRRASACKPLCKSSAFVRVMPVARCATAATIRSVCASTMSPSLATSQ